MRTRPASDAETEERVLTTAVGRCLIAEVGCVAHLRPADLARFRRLASSEEVTAALRLVEARRRSARKFSRAGRMWLDPIGGEQATAEAVARHKARRFSTPLVVDFCAGIGGDSLALAAASHVLSVDADLGMCCRCRWNAAVYDVAARVTPIRARAERFGIPRGALVHIDPDRRTGPGPRARLLEDYAPGLHFLRSLPEHAPGGAIKLGPASDYARHFHEPGLEVELVSLGGECKEATVWFGTLAGCRRRATRLPEGVTWTDRDGPAEPFVHAVAPESGSWIFDPDPALVRSELLASFAAAHGLSRCAPGVDYLTAAAPVRSPWLASFAVLEVFPFDLKTLRRVVRGRGLNPLEIKVRGLDTRPEAVRKSLRPAGTNPATLILYGGSGPARAVLARRARASPVTPA